MKEIAAKQAPAVEAGARDGVAAYLVRGRDSYNEEYASVWINKGNADAAAAAIFRASITPLIEARAALARASNELDERAEFETFVHDKSPSLSAECDVHGRYRDPVVCRWWEGWQAALARASEAAAAPLAGWKSARTEPPKMDAPPHFSITVLGVVDDPRFHNQDDNKPFVDIVAYWPALNKWTITHSSIKDMEADDFEVSVAWWMPLPSAPVNRKYRLAAPQPASKQQAARGLSDEQQSALLTVLELADREERHRTNQAWLKLREGIDKARALLTAAKGHGHAD